MKFHTEYIQCREATLNKCDITIISAFVSLCNFSRLIALLCVTVCVRACVRVLTIQGKVYSWKGPVREDQRVDSMLSLLYI